DIRLVLMHVAQIWIEGVMFPAIEKTIHVHCGYHGDAADESTGKRIGEPDSLAKIGGKALEMRGGIVLHVRAPILGLHYRSRTERMDPAQAVVLRGPVGEI